MYGRFTFLRAAKLAHESIVLCVFSSLVSIRMAVLVLGQQEATLHVYLSLPCLAQN